MPCQGSLILPDVYITQKKNLGTENVVSKPEMFETCNEV